MRSSLTDRRACDGWRQVFDETWQEPNPSQPFYWTYWRRTVLWKSSPKWAQKKRPFFPQEKGKLASRGNNVYVLDFKHFLPVRKSRCKGMFFCLKDLRDFFFFLSHFSVFSFSFLVTWWSDGALTLHHPQHTEDVKYACRSLSNVQHGILLKSIMWAMWVSHSLAHL